MVFFGGDGFLFLYNIPMSIIDTISMAINTKYLF